MMCDHCMKEVKPDCDWRQGRCPHRPAPIDEFKKCPYGIRFYNLIDSIKKWFK